MSNSRVNGRKRIIQISTSLIIWKTTNRYGSIELGRKTVTNQSSGVVCLRVVKGCVLA